MAIAASAQVNTCYIKRGTGMLDYNNPYTVLFSLYLPTNSNPGSTYDQVWAIGGATGSSSDIAIGQFHDGIEFNSSGVIAIEVATTAGTQYQYAALAAGWHRISVRRTAATALIFRVNGADRITGNRDVTGREAASQEFMLCQGTTGGASQTGTAITNYKAWQAALTGAEIDAEHATTEFIVTANKWSGSIMGDESILANNLTADGSGTNWTAGADTAAAANDPGVNYGSSVKPAAYYSQL